MHKLRFIFPNMFSLAALSLGCLALQEAAIQNYHLSLLLILAAAVIDFLDGYIARKLQAESEFGKQLDALADLVNFGVVPGFTLFMLYSPGWTPATLLSILFVLSCCIRLARYNAPDTSAAASARAGYFLGLPSPAAALVVLSTYPTFAFLGHHLATTIALGIAGIIAMFMIAPIQFKKLRPLLAGLPAHQIALLGSMLAAGIFLSPGITLFSILTLYIGLSTLSQTLSLFSSPLETEELFSFK